MEGLFYGLITAAYMGTIRLLPKTIDKSVAWLGTLSYSLYLNQAWAMEIGIKVLNALNVDMTDFWTAMTIGMAIIFPILLIMSVGTYYLIEKPFLQMRTKYLKPVAKIESEGNKLFPETKTADRSMSVS